MAALQQGDVRLLDHPVAQRLLHEPVLGSLGYVGRDGAPRVLPIGFVWNGSAAVMATYATSAKLRALRRRPQVALTVDRAGPPPEVLMIRGGIECDDVAGVPVEYRQMQAKYYGEEQAAAVVAEIERTGARMVRMVLRPQWVGVLDFRSRVPGALVEAGLAG